MHTAGGFSLRLTPATQIGSPELLRLMRMGSSAARPQQKLHSPKRLPYNGESRKATAGVAGVEHRSSPPARSFIHLNACRTMVRVAKRRYEMRLMNNRFEEAMDENNELATVYQGRHLSMRTRGHWEFATRNMKKPAVGIVAITTPAMSYWWNRFVHPSDEPSSNFLRDWRGTFKGLKMKPL